MNQSVSVSKLRNPTSATELVPRGGVEAAGDVAAAPDAGDGGHLLVLPRVQDLEYPRPLLVAGEDHGQLDPVVGAHEELHVEVLHLHGASAKVELEPSLWQSGGGRTAVLPHCLTTLPLVTGDWWWLKGKLSSVGM